MQQSDTRLLLEEMQNLGAAQAENSRDENFGRWFLPIPSHLKALKPDVSIIIGERGAGKSELFRGITTPRILKAIYEQLPHLELPANDEGLVKI